MLLESMAASLGPRAVGVVLSGMGSDGARGVSALASAGALTVAQDEPSAAVFGMPKAAVAHGARALASEAIVDVLRSLTPKGATR
jgi:two-component system chemotaxis response regulator CheB